MSNINFIHQTNIPNPTELSQLWDTAYSTHISQDINVCIGSDVSKVDLANSRERAGACLQNALRVMKRMIEAGIPENELRAVYFINYTNSSGTTELCMTNSELRKEEQLVGNYSDEDDNRMSYHVTIVHNPTGGIFWDQSQLEDSHVFDLTASRSRWGDDFYTFTDDIFFDDELLLINKNLVAFVLNLDSLNTMNDRLCRGVDTYIPELKRISDTFVKLDIN